MIDIEKAIETLEKADRELAEAQKEARKVRLELCQANRDLFRAVSIIRDALWSGATLWRPEAQDFMRQFPYPANMKSKYNPRRKGIEQIATS